MDLSTYWEQAKEWLGPIWAVISGVLLEHPYIVTLLAFGVIAWIAGRQRERLNKITDEWLARTKTRSGIEERLGTDMITVLSGPEQGRTAYLFGALALWGYAGFVASSIPERWSITILWSAAAFPALVGSLCFSSYVDELTYKERRRLEGNIRRWVSFMAMFAALAFLPKDTHILVGACVGVVAATVVFTVLGLANTADIVDDVFERLTQRKEMQETREFLDRIAKSEYEAEIAKVVSDTKAKREEA